MGSYKKPAKLISLTQYSPYQATNPRESLISRERQLIYNKTHTEPERSRKRSQPLIDTCVRSFIWMYRSPGHRVTSFHEEQLLGKIRKTKLPPIENPAQSTFSSPKQVIMRKPTITMRKTRAYDMDSGVLVENVSKGSLKFISACIYIKGNSVYVPISSLKDVIYASEGEVMHNITQSIKDIQWSKGSNLYSSYKEVPEDYKFPYFLPNLEVSAFIIKSVGIYSRVLGKTIRVLENKGLIMKANKLVNRSGPVLVMAWEGSEAQIVCKNLAGSINSDFFYFLKDEELPEYLNPDEIRQIYSFVTPSFTCRLDKEYIKVVYPTIAYSLASRVLPVPLGTLKEFIGTGFQDWGEKWVQKYGYTIQSRRSGAETSSLKASVCFKDNPCVLCLNSYEIRISNPELEASFAFKISDLEYIFNHCGPDLIPSLMTHAKLQSKPVKSRKQWDLSIDIHELPSNPGDVPKETQVKIQGKDFLCVFTPPCVELYLPHTEQTTTKQISRPDISKILESDYNGWEETLLKYFT